MMALLLCLCQSLPGLAPALDSIIPELMKRHRVPGVAMAVVRGPEVRLAGFGYTRLDDSSFAFAVPVVAPARTRSWSRT